ncbi:MAG: preprotein translocase subunit YajC [Pseudonocardiaceae bacterium]
MDPLFLPLLLIAALALPLILGSRRQKRMMAEAHRLQSSLVVGDRVLTTSGLQATVVSTTHEDSVELEIAPSVRTTWLRAAIREKISDDVDAAEDDRPDDASAQLAPSLEDTARTDRA